MDAVFERATLDEAYAYHKGAIDSRQGRISRDEGGASEERFQSSRKSESISKNPRTFSRATSTPGRSSKSESGASTGIYSKLFGRRSRNSDSDSRNSSRASIPPCTLSRRVSAVSTPVPIITPITAYCFTGGSESLEIRSEIEYTDTDTDSNTVFHTLIYGDSNLLSVSREMMNRLDPLKESLVRVGTLDEGLFERWKAAIAQFGNARNENYTGNQSNSIYQLSAENARLKNDIEELQEQISKSRKRERELNMVIKNLASHLSVDSKDDDQVTIQETRYGF